MQIINGRRLAERIIHRLKSEVAALPFKPVFCDLLVGDNPVSAGYVNLKARRAQNCGLKFLRADFAEDATTPRLISRIQSLNRVENLCGLIVQLPLPPQINRAAVLDAIDPLLDVDCIGQERSQRFYQGDLEIVPPTAAAILSILDALRLDLAKKNILIVGQGKLVGGPLTFLLKRRGLKIHTADATTANAAELIKGADIIVSATGQPKLITGDKIRKGAVVIDAGTAEDGGQIVGDVDLESIKGVASAVSPVPGGVGPVTVAMLLGNVLKVARRKMVQKNYRERTKQTNKD